MGTIQSRTKAVNTSKRRNIASLRLSVFVLAGLAVFVPTLPSVVSATWGRMCRLAVSLGSLVHSGKSVSSTVQLPIEQHLVHIPFFIEGDGFTSVLTLNNNMPQPTSVKVTLFNLNGESLIQPTIALPAELPGRFDIGDLTRQAKAGQFTSGNIAFSFSGVEEGVTAQVSIISASRRQAFESSDNETEDFKTSRLDGILWAPDAQSKASLALTNTSDEPLTVSGTATTNLGLQSIKAELGPHATQVVDVTRFVVLGPLAVSQTTIAPALMTLQHGGNPGDLMVTGFVTNDKTGFSSNLPFVDGSTVVSNHMAGAHIRMNQPAAIEGFPVGTRFSAPLVLANTGGESSQAAISVEYTLASVPHRIQLPSVTLAPRDIQQIDLAQALAARGILGPFDDDGVDIIYAGAPGTVIGRLTSLDQTRDFSFDVPVKDPLAGTNRVNGDYPWRLDNGFKTIVHIKNVLDTPAHAEVQIRYDGGTYNPELISLQPHQTIDLDIGAIRDARQPDIRGSVMPKDIVSGQLIWVEMTPGSLMGRAEVSNVGQAIASSFSCSGPSNCPNSLFGTALSPNSATMSVGDSTKPFTAKETDQNCLQVLFGQYTVGAIITWSSNDTSVATVDSSGNVTAVGPGSAVISAQWEAVVYECLNFCSLVNANPVATASVTIRPKITGTSSIWWFGGASPPGYVTATTLTASPPNGSSYQWAITAGSVVFSNGSTSITTSTNQVLVRSSGRSPDNQPNDVKIQVTVKGVQSNPFTMTVLAPHVLIPIGLPTDSADATFTYASLISYTVTDQYRTQLPMEVPSSEFFATNVIADYPGTNWSGSSPSAGSIDPSEFRDLVSGPMGLGGIPEPTPPQAPLSPTKVVHRSGQFQIGVNTSGQGLVVQTQTWQHYIDHGRHENVVSPVPGQ